MAGQVLASPLPCPRENGRRLARAALIPLLQAEEDVRYVIAKRAADEKEAELMSGVPGWKVGASVFNSGAWMPPTLK